MNTGDTKNNIQLLVLADDLTGAVDTGIQFTSYGADVKVLVCETVTADVFSGLFAEVLVIDLETRHGSKENAYRAVHQAVSAAVKANILYVYIKTDSCLRGNIEGSLTAALHAGNISFLPFIPAYPKLHRVTKKGIHYVEGVRIHESIFGKDPFDPVVSSKVRDLFCMSAVTVYEFFDAPYLTLEKKNAIGIFDASTTEDMKSIAAHLFENHELFITAGCAGFAEVLSSFFSFQKKNKNIPVLPKNIFAVCGSLHQVSKKQLSYAKEQLEFFGISLTAKEQLLYNEEVGAALLTLLQSKDYAFLDTGRADAKEKLQLIEALSLSSEAVRVRISEALGDVVLFFWKSGFFKNRLLFIIGGDTLLQIVKRLKGTYLFPIKELLPGVVLSGIRVENQDFFFVSKSGGFGDVDFFEKIREIL